MDTKISENFISLALKPSKGTFLIAGNYFTYGMLGAMLMDLVLNNRIEVEGKKIRIASNSGITGIEAYDLIIKQIGDSKTERNIGFWLRKFAFRAGWYKKEMLSRMSNSGILRVKRKRFLGIPYKVYFMSDLSRSKKLIIRLKDIILYNKEPNETELMILGLVQACQLHRALSADRAERQKLRRSLKKYLKENSLASGIGNTIMEAQAAVSAAITAAVVVSTTAARR